MAWVEAIAHCKGEGGKLVEIDSEEESTALVEEMKRRGFKDRNFWMGLTDRESHGEWTLETSGSKPSYLNWADNEPNTEGYDCAQIWNDERFSGTWVDIPCRRDDTVFWNGPYKTFHALCEFPDSGDRLGTNHLLIAVAKAPFICFTIKVAFQE